MEFWQIPHPLWKQRITRFMLTRPSISHSAYVVQVAYNDGLANILWRFQKLLINESVLLKDIRTVFTTCNLHSRLWFSLPHITSLVETSSFLIKHGNDHEYCHSSHEALTRFLFPQKSCDLKGVRKMCPLCQLISRNPTSPTFSTLQLPMFFLHKFNLYRHKYN